MKRQKTRNDPFLSCTEYAALMNLNATTVRRNCNKGDIKGAIKAGSQWRIYDPRLIATDELQKSSSQD